MRKIATILLMCIIAINTIAQEKKEYTNFNDTTFSINEVVISQQKKEMVQMLNIPVPVNFLPVSVNSLSSVTLEKRGIRNIQDALRFMPGAEMKTSYGGFQTLYIRGFSHQPIMIDGMRDERTTVNSYPFMDLSSIESVELLKGPAAVFYGHASVGGILNIVRKQPSEKQSVNARISIGSYDKKSATIGMGGKLIGPLNYRANINYSDEEGYRHAGNKRFSGYIAIGGKIDEKNSIDIRGGFNRDFYGTEIGLPDVMKADVYANDGSLFLRKGEMQHGLDHRARYNNESDFMWNRAWNASAQWKHSFSDKVKFTNKTSFNYDDIDYFGTESLDYLESDSPIYDHYYMKGNAKRYICLDTVKLTFPLRFAHISNTITNKSELTAQFNTASIKHNVLAGYSFMNMNRVSYSGYKLGTDVVGPGLFSHVSVRDPHSMGYMTSSMSKASIYHYYAHGVYLNDLIEVGDKWKVMLSGRYDFFKYLKATAPASNGDRDYSPHEQSNYDGLTNQALTFKVGAVYSPIDELQLYGSVSNFFKPIYTFFSDNYIYINKEGHEFFPNKGKEIFKPESGYQAEAGFKFELNRQLTINGSAFYILKENTVQKLGQKDVDQNGETVSMTVKGQVASMDSKGFDVDLTYSPLSNLNFGMGYNMTIAKVRELAQNDYLTSSSDQGKYQTDVPKNSFYALASYAFDKGVFEGLELHITNSFTDKIYRNTSNESYFNSYWLTDLGASYQLPNGVALTLNVNNLFSSKYFKSSLGDQLVPTAPANFEFAISYQL